MNVDNGWIWRVRVDYLLGDNTKIYGSYQQAFSSGFAQGNGAHLYWTPGNAIPFPGGGEVENNYGKTMAGHIVHNFNATTTNDFMAAWAFGSYPFTTPNPSAAYRTTLGYTYGKVFSHAVREHSGVQQRRQRNLPGLLAGLDLREPCGTVCGEEGSSAVQRHADQGVGNCTPSRSADSRRPRITSKARSATSKMES